MLISEFDFPTYTEAGQALDLQRYDLLKTSYYQTYLTELLTTIHLDHGNMLGMLACCFIETNVFGSFIPHDGLQTLNLTTQERTYSRSMCEHVNFFRGHVWE